MNTQNYMVLMENIKRFETQAFAMLLQLLTEGEMKRGQRFQKQDTNGEDVAFYVFEEFPRQPHISMSVWTEQLGAVAYAREFRFSVIHDLQRVNLKSYSERLQLRKPIDQLTLIEHEKAMGGLVDVLTDLVTQKNKLTGA